MAPWPEQGNEPKAPDKFGKIGENLPSDVSKVNFEFSANVDVNVTASRSGDKQTEDKNSDVSNLDDGQLKALLDEAITYKCPKDREGKSNLFRELLQEVEADESKGEDTCHGSVIRSTDIGACRYVTGNRRKNRKDGGISERQTKGGSLQNLVQALSCEFDGATSLGYFASGHSSGGGRRRTKKNSFNRDSVNVSARQREGGSLPSNVNVGGVQSGFELVQDSTFHSGEPKCYSSKSAMPTKRKEKSSHCSSHSTNDDISAPLRTNVAPPGDDALCHSLPKQDIMLIELSDLNISDERNGKFQESSGAGRHFEQVGRVGVQQMYNDNLNGDGVSDKVCSSAGKLENGESLVGNEVYEEDYDGKTQQNYTALATLEVGNNGLQESNEDIENLLKFPFPQGDRDDRIAYATDQNPLQLASSYNPVKCIMGSNTPSTSDFSPTPSTSTGIRDSERTIKGWEMRASVMYCTGAELYRKAPTGENAKTPIINPNVYPTHHLSVLSIPPNHTWITSLGPSGEGRLTFHGSKEVDTKCKSLDENGNAVSQACRVDGMGSNERKSKQRRAKINNDRNVIMSQNIEGHRGDKDIDSLIKFIESDTEGKARHKNTSHNTGPLTLNSKQQRSSYKKEELGSVKSKRDAVHEDEKGYKTKIHGTKQVPKDKCPEKSKLKKSNSLEEISKSKIEDLMSFTTVCNNDTEAQVNKKHFKRTRLDSDFIAINKKSDSSQELCSEDDHSLFILNSAGDKFFSPVLMLAEREKWQRSEEKSKSEHQSLSKDENIAISAPAEDTEFHIVRKKQRRKKRCSISGGVSGAGKSGILLDSETSYMGRVSKDFLSQQTQKEKGFPPHDGALNHNGESVLCSYRHHRPCSPEHHRRKSTSSMPPSEKSDSSDLDSVHSLPVSSTTPKLAFDKMSTSSGSTPQASYADIARMAAANSVPVTEMCCSSFSNSKLSSLSSTKMTGFVCSGGVSNSFSSSSQFVSAGSKTNVGTPPTSGSKAVIVSEESVVSILGAEIEKPGNQREICQKKDAMTNTTVDYNLALYCVENSVKSDNFELEQGSVLNDYYPSLEESLYVDKCERKFGKQCNPSFTARSLVDNMNVPISPLVKKYVDVVCVDESSVVDVQTVNTENTLSTDVIVSVGSVEESTKSCDLKDVEDLSEQLPLKSCIQESVSKMKVEASDFIVPSVNSCIKATNCAQSVKLESKTRGTHESKRNRIFNNSPGRPPVILMNESLPEGLSCDSELTFGFEVNEQLLLSNGDDELREKCEDPSAIACEQSYERQKNPLVNELPQNTFSFEKFLSRYRKPQAQVTDDRIVNFVGFAWNDIMKEANSADGKVQYYSGQ